MEMKAVFRENRGGKALCPVERFGSEAAKRARCFHENFPEYQATPLAALEGLAKRVGVASIYVRGEGCRFGLNENSRVLCFSTEGDTDRENYGRIVWDIAI